MTVGVATGPWMWLQGCGQGCRAVGRGRGCRAVGEATGQWARLQGSGRGCRAEGMASLGREVDVNSECS